MMGVTATKLVDRAVYEVTYEGAESRDGGIVARFTAQGGNESDYRGLDDGKFVVTFASGQSGSADCVIEDVDGNEIDSGSVTFG